MCNTTVYHHFDYACVECYSILFQQNPKDRTANTPAQIYVRFSLKLNNTDHIGLSNLRKKNWFPIKYPFEQCIISTSFKFFSNKSPAYMNDVFKEAGQPNTKTRTCFLKLNQPLWKTSHWWEKLS